MAKPSFYGVASAPMAYRIFTALIVAFLSAPTALAVVTNDVTCLRNAANDRTARLHAAYDEYARDMNAIADRLRDDESRRLEYGDYSFRQSEISRTYSNYTYELTEKSRDLSSKLTEAWNKYQQARNVCNASAQPESLQPAYVPPNYGAPSYGYGYGSGYPSYGSSYYNGGYGSNPYYGSYNYQGYDDAYYRHGAATGTCAPPRPLSQPPPGCGYQYGTDSNGCQTVSPVCRNAQSNTSPCTCPASYAPVCSRDGQTYFNACYAVCMGASVQYQGACGGYRQ